MTRNERRGMTIVEALTSCFILGLLTTVIFTVFQLGSRNFRTLVVRQGIQSEARRISALMRRDLVVTSFRTASTLDRTSALAAAPLNERDLVSMATLDSWIDSSNYDSTRKPLWNRYTVWYATSSDAEKSPPPGRPELGQLVRKQVIPTSPAPPVIFPMPMQNPSLGSLTVSPDANTDGFQILTRNLLHFSVTLDPADENVMVHIVLRQPGLESATGQKRETETFECHFDIRPENTWPSQ